MRRLTATIVVALAATACSGDLPATAPTCEAFEVLAVQAQALPEAQEVPCLQELPFGWTVTTFEAESGGATYHLSHAAFGNDVVQVGFAPECVSPSTGETVALEAGEDQDRVLEQGPALYRAERFEAVDGACIVTAYAFDTEGWADGFEEIDELLVSIARDDLTQRLLDETDGVLDLDRSGSGSSSD